MKLSGYHRWALRAYLAKEAAQLAANRKWIDNMPACSPEVDWKGHRLHKALVSALYKVLEFPPGPEVTQPRRNGHAKEAP